MFYRDLADVANELNREQLDLDGVLRVFCMRKFADRRFFATFFLQIGKDGRLKINGFFGANPADIGISEEGISVFDDHPASECIRKNQMICTPASSIEGSIIAWPIERNSQVLGSLLAISDAKCDESPESQECLDALALLVSSTLANKINVSSPEIRKKSLQGEMLTERQQLILKMISEGRTNGDIAEILGYSESLIRQETIKIYAILGCNGRHEATQIFLSKHGQPSPS